MSMVIQHNIPALQSYNIVNATSNALQKSIAKLSSGLRINSAADDAAGLAISEKMRAQVNGLDRAVSNAQDGVSMIQTAEGALSETHSMLQRMRELSVQAANDTLTQQDRSYIQEEVDQLREEITRVGNTTQFNTKKLLNGDASALWSSSDSNTKAIIKGSLREVDQFGQKKSVEGNYKIKIKADPGKAEVQKSDIMKIKHPNVMTNKVVDTAAGINDVEIDGVPAGSYQISLTGNGNKEGSTGALTVTNVTGEFGIDHAFSSSTLTGAVARNTDAARDADAATKDNLDSYDNRLVRITDGTSTLAEYEVQVGDSIQDVQQNLMNQLNGEKAQAIAAQNGYKLESYWNDADMFYAVAYTTDGTQSKSLTYEGGASSAGGTLAAVASTPADTTTYAHIKDMITVTTNPDVFDGNASILFEVTDVNTQANTVTLKATADILTRDGINKTTTVSDIVLHNGQNDVTQVTGLMGKDYTTADQADNTGAFDMKLLADDNNVAKLFSKGDKFVWNVTDDTDLPTGSTKTVNTVKIDAQLNPDWDEGWAGGAAVRTPLNYNVIMEDVAGKDVHFKNFYLNEDTGEAIEGDVIISFDEQNFNKNNTSANPQDERTVSTFNAAYIGQTATGDVKLRDLDKFWDSQGKFLLDDPKTITLVQGDGKTADVTLYSYDTLDEVAEKLNNAISSGLGQGQYVDDATHFAEFVGSSATQNLSAQTNDSVAGTFVIRSAVPGTAGTISISGNDEDLLNAFSLNTLQTATESKYNVSVYDAHTGEAIARDVSVTGNKMIGVIHENVDVEFDAMNGVSSSWDEKSKSYKYDKSKETETTLHIADNSTVLQIGANEGEDMAISIGDMRSRALGLDAVNVMDRDLASRSITIIDNAIDKVSTQRAKLGAYQNRLEYTINNLTTESENLTSAESRIRDADMAKEMMEFTKLNIMLQAGNSMLAQANQQPQNVLSLIR